MADDLTLTRRLRIAESRMVAEGIREFTLVNPDGAALPAFKAGAHLPLKVPNGMLRRYSLSNDPAEADRYVIAAKREEGGAGGSRSLVDEARDGDVLEAGDPQNDFALTGKTVPHLFVAGGIGVTPLLSMARHLMSSGGPAFQMVYLTRTPAMTAYRAELRAPAFRGKVTIHHDEGDPERAFDLWPLLEQPKGRQLYCCGPRGLMESVRDMTGHWPTSAVHFEDFGGAAAARRADDAPFTLRLARSGRVVDVPRDRSALAALREAGVAVPFSCEGGTCGSCRTGLLGGEVDHRDFVLTEKERSRYWMPCVSRAATAGGDVTIEL
ncbi:PDR/VanB family oxidoreductase [Roseomonas sp. CCTCC AB2023176]|uniref:PDR/VanB family oxidoreductase n=1 Tax=Roseomonas sp. CCTCC AB2023176 TaxID=3342640 RepID=UPI0035E0F258